MKLTCIPGNYDTQIIVEVKTRIASTPITFEVEGKIGKRGVYWVLIDPEFINVVDVDKVRQWVKKYSDKLEVFVNEEIFNTLV